MKKRILISVALAVFVLEVGFGVYVAFERKYESALNSLNLPIDSVKEIQTATDRELELASLLPAEDIIADTHASVVAKKPIARAVNLLKTESKLVATNVPAKRQTKSVVKAESGKQMVAVKAAENREIPATDLNARKEEPQRPENKSFIAKTQTILKKPFGWIKAIGSKLR